MGREFYNRTIHVMNYQQIHYQYLDPVNPQLLWANLTRLWDIQNSQPIPLQVLPDYDNVSSKNAGDMSGGGAGGVSSGGVGDKSGGGNADMSSGGTADKSGGGQAGGESSGGTADKSPPSKKRCIRF